MTSRASSAARSPRPPVSARHRARLLLLGTGLCVVDALATVVDPESQTLLWLALPAVAIAFAAFARSESRDWGRPLASGHQLVLVFWPHVGVPAYLLSTTQRRSLVLTFGLVVVLLLHALWPMLASAGLVRLVLGGG